MKRLNTSRDGPPRRWPGSPTSQTGVLVVVVGHGASLAGMSRLLGLDEGDRWHEQLLLVGALARRVDSGAGDCWPNVGAAGAVEIAELATMSDGGRRKPAARRPRQVALVSCTLAPAAHGCPWLVSASRGHSSAGRRRAARDLGFEPHSPLQGIFELKLLIGSSVVIQFPICWPGRQFHVFTSACIAAVTEPRAPRVRLPPAAALATEGVDGLSPHRSSGAPAHVDR